MSHSKNIQAEKSYGNGSHMKKLALKLFDLKNSGEITHSNIIQAEKSYGNGSDIKKSVDKDDTKKFDGLTVGRQELRH